MVYRFGRFELDENVYELRREGADLRIRRRSFEVLRLLIDERHRVVAKDEVLDRVWERRFVSQSALANCISELRSAFGGELESSAIIRTVYGRGYRFVAKLDEAVEAALEPRANGTTPNGVVAPAPRPAHDPFVGRERELERLDAALDEAVQGRAQIALLLGEAGIGKTATAARFAARARARSVRVLEGSCSDGGVAPIGWPWPRLLRALLGERPRERAVELLGESAAALGQLLPELHGAESGRRPQQPPLDAERPSGLIEVATRVLLRAVSAPLVLILDDVHLADAISLNLLGFLAGELRDASVLLVCTLQPPGRALASPFLRVLSDLTRHPRTQSLELEPLSRDEVEQLVVRADSARVVAGGLAERIYERSEGNPLFVSQLVRLLEDHPDGDGPPGDVALPPGLSATISLRLGRLSPGCRTLLGVAAALGRDFRSHLLQRATELPPRECLDLLQEAVDARLVEETSPQGSAESFRFRHGLIQAAVYQGLAAGERAEIHRRIGVALRGTGDKVPDEIAGDLAHHYYQSHDPALAEKAVKYSRLAASHAAAHRAYDRAAEHLTRAVNAASELALDPRLLCDLELACIAELRRSAQFARANEMLEKAIGHARALRDPGRLAGAALVAGGFDLMGSADPVWCRLLDEALRGAGRAPSPVRASLLISQAMARLNADPVEVNEARVREALAIAHEHSCRSIQILAMSFLYAFVAGPERVGELRATIDKFLRVGLSSPLPAARMGAAIAQAAHRIEWLDPGDGGAHGGFSSTVVGDERTPALLGSRIARELLRGRVDEAERDIEVLWRDWLPLANDGRLPVGLACHLLLLRRDQGRMSELDPFVRGMVERWPEVSLWSAFMAFLCAETGRSAEAVELLATLARDGFAALPRNGFWLGNAVLLAEAAAEIGHAPTASLLYSLLSPFADRAALVGKLVCAGPVALPLGRLATVLDRYAEAETHLDAAERGCAALHSTSFELRTRLARAELLVARGELSQAEQVRAETRAQARELGLHGLAARA